MELYLDPLKGTTPTAPAAFKVEQMTMSWSNKRAANKQHGGGEMFLSWISGDTNFIDGLGVLEWEAMGRSW